MFTVQYCSQSFISQLHSAHFFSFHSSSIFSLFLCLPIFFTTLLNIYFLFIYDTFCLCLCPHIHLKMCHVISASLDLIYCGITDPEQSTIIQPPCLCQLIFTSFVISREMCKDLTLVLKETQLKEKQSFFLVQPTKGLLWTGIWKCRGKLCFFLISQALFQNLKQSPEEKMVNTKFKCSLWLFFFLQSSVKCQLQTDVET